MTERYDEYTLSKECDALAQAILDDFIRDDDLERSHIDEYDDDLNDRVHEYVDGHQYVIYNYQALRFVAECNCEDGEIFLEEIGLPDDVDIYKLASTILYGEMRARITATLESLVAAHNERVDDLEDESEDA